MRILARWMRFKFVEPFLSDSSHLDVLTGIRGWAALWVFLYHAWSLSGYPDFTVVLAGVTLDFTPLVSMGLAGVTIFFVLSGFLLAIPFAEWQSGLRQRPALDRYFLRRVMRVFPAYYAQLAILLLIAAWVPGQTGIDDWGSLFRHLLMLFTPPPLGTLPINNVWWTLPIEFSFYLVLPLLALLLRPGRWWLLLAGSPGGHAPLAARRGLAHGGCVVTAACRGGLSVTRLHGRFWLGHDGGVPVREPAAPARLGAASPESGPARPARFGAGACRGLLVAWKTP